MESCLPFPLSESESGVAGQQEGRGEVEQFAEGEHLVGEEHRDERKEEADSTLMPYRSTSDEASAGGILYHKLSLLAVDPQSGLRRPSEKRPSHPRRQKREGHYSFL